MFVEVVIDDLAGEHSSDYRDDLAGRGGGHDVVVILMAIVSACVWI